MRTAPNWVASPRECRKRIRSVQTSSNSSRLIFSRSFATSICTSFIHRGGLISGVGIADDGADPGLVEPLEALPALQDLQMAAGSALCYEAFCLFGRNGVAGDEGRSALRRYRPHFGLREHLFEHLEVGKGRHDPEPRRLEIRFRSLEIEFALDMVHSRHADAVAMQGAPEADGPQLVARSKVGVGEIDVQLLRGDVQIGEDDDPADRVLQHLRPPSRFGPRIEPLAGEEAQGMPELHQCAECGAGAAVGVVVVIRPTEAERLLLGILPLRRAVAGQVVVPLGGEELVCGSIQPDLPNDTFDQLLCLTEHGDIFTASVTLAQGGAYMG